MPVSSDSIEKAVLAAIVAALPSRPVALTRFTRLLDIDMDSLTLVTVMSEIEVAYGVAFDTDEITEILMARDIGDVIAAAKRKLDSIR